MCRSRTDQIDERLRAISSFLDATRQYRPDSHMIAAPAYDLKPLDSIKLNVKIRSVAEDMAMSIAMDEPTFHPRQPSSPLSDSSLYPTIVPGRRQLEHEFEENRTILKRLQKYNLWDTAVGIQRRALEIKTILAEKDLQQWASTTEHDEMMETLADLLILCLEDGPHQEALNILQEQLNKLTASSRSLTSDTIIPSNFRKCNSLRLKLGKAYKDIGQLGLAMDHLRTAFDTYENASVEDSEHMRAAGEQLLEVHKLQVQASEGSQKAVRISQLRAFRTELEKALGRPIGECKEAVAWCTRANLEVYGIDHGQYRFDVVDPDGNTSPLHFAADKCQDETILRQIMENSETYENLAGEDRETPLLVAVANANTAAIELLLKLGANSKATDKAGNTVLHKANQPPILKLLLQPRLRQASTATDISLTVPDPRPDSSSSSRTMTTATTNSSVPTEYDLDIDAQNIYKETALWSACSAGRLTSASLLLRAGANPEICRYGTSPLVAAIESTAQVYNEDLSRRLKVIESLIRYGADRQPGKNLLQNPRGHMQKRILKELERQPDPGSRITFHSPSYESRGSSFGGSSGHRLSLSPTFTRLSPLNSLELDPFPDLPDFSESQEQLK